MLALQMLYNALRLGHPDTEAFKAEEEHLPFLNAAMQRQKADEYRQYDLTNKLQDLNQIYGTKDESRRTFEVRETGAKIDKTQCRKW